MSDKEKAREIFLSWDKEKQETFSNNVKQGLKKMFPSLESLKRKTEKQEETPTNDSN